MKIIISFLILIFTVGANAQDTITVTKDARLDLLTQKQAAINKRNAMLTPAGLYKGYRVQVIVTNSRETAFKIKGELMERFPQHQAYAPYQSPYFKVRVGNFLKREDAQKFLKELSKFYKDGLYVIEDGIDYKPTEEEQLIED